MRESNVFITKVSKFLPNEPVENSSMECKLGMIGNKPSRAKSIILRQNQIKTRYYAIDNNGELNYSNSQLAAESIRTLFKTDDIRNVELLCCGSSSPDQLVPSLATQVHGEFPLSNNIEVMSPSGLCCSGSTAFKYGYMSVLCGQTNNAVCTGSELFSPLLMAKNFDSEFENLSMLENNPILAFEKDFLRWMLSDGAGAFFIVNKPNPTGISLKVNWIETFSYANELKTCMYQGADRNINGDLISWKTMNSDEWLYKSIFSIKQDARYLDKHGVNKSVISIKNSFQKHGVNPDEISYFLPHISSMYFYQRLKDALDECHLNIPIDRWYTNLTDIGNIGAASIYIMVEELFNSDRLKKGDKIFLFIPESGRFSFATAILEVV